MRSSIRRAVVVGAALMVASPLLAHDMFLRLGQFFAAENANVPVELFNGTFVLSENSITRDRLADIAVVSPSGRTKLDTAQWGVAGDTSRFSFRTGSAGTYVLGVSTKPRVLRMQGAAFNAYLASDGIPDELAARRAQKRLREPARERYEKHVKALVQVGATPGPGFATVLGYPAEIVPTLNPYAAKAGSVIPMRLLVGGQPMPRQFVQYGGLTASGSRLPQRFARSDANGIVSIPIIGPGTYYVKFIAMQRITGDAEADHHSRWASLTFAVK